MPRINQLTNKQILALRDGIIFGARCYVRYLLDKEFLVLCEDGSMHVVRFWRKKYAHLTGLVTGLNANQFFSYCRHGIISSGNICSEQKYDFRTLYHKIDFVSHIHELIYMDVQITYAKF